MATRFVRECADGLYFDEMQILGKDSEGDDIAEDLQGLLLQKSPMFGSAFMAEMQKKLAALSSQP